MRETAVETVCWWLPDLSRFDRDHPVRALTARADVLEPGPRGYLAGLAGYFETGSELPAAALTRQALVGDAADALWLSADPAWVQPDLNGARLLACGQLGLTPDEAQALAEPLLAVFAEAGMTLVVSTPDRWHLRLPPDTELPVFAAPEQALGEDVFEHLPPGAAGKRWRLLLNEAQILLHQHPVNRARRERGLPPINSVWLWGGGCLPAGIRSRLSAVVGDDILLAALAQRAGVTVHARTPDRLAAAGAGTLIDLQDLPAEAIARDWWVALAPLIRSRPIALDFASGERLLHRPWHRLRVWRRRA